MFCWALQANAGGGGGGSRMRGVAVEGMAEGSSPQSEGRDAAGGGVPSSSGKKRPFLDVPSGDGHRVGAVSRLLYEEFSKAASRQPVGDSDIARKVRRFLPQLAADNERLASLDEVERKRVDIESLESDDATFVNMELALCKADDEGKTIVERLEAQVPDDAPLVLGKGEPDADPREETEAGAQAAQAGEAIAEGSGAHKRSTLIEEL